jgi:Skp family chaperone for outer membrane proteins
MKKSSILALATVLIAILSSSSLLADPPEGKGWKADKEQKKYEKEMRKKEREYEREEAKKRREMEREEAKDRREYEREERKHRKEMDREDRERYEDDDRDDYEYRRDRYESESSIQDDALDTAVESALPESLKGTAAEDVIREEAKRWWER